MTRILLTNDDGIHSNGLIKLEEALKTVGDVYVVAPVAEMSGASHSLTLARPLRIRQIDERHWTVDGTPTDCVTLALNKILSPEEMPDICASGINHGGNFGEAAQFAKVAVQKVLTEGLPDGTLLNINIPAKEIRGVRVTRQGIKNARPVISEHIDPRGKPYFWIGEEYFNNNSADGTDYNAIDLGYISVTPLKSDMTDHRALTAIESWNYLKDQELLHKT